MGRVKRPQGHQLAHDLAVSRSSALASVSKPYRHEALPLNGEETTERIPLSPQYVVLQSTSVNKTVFLASSVLSVGGQLVEVRNF